MEMRPWSAAFAFFKLQFSSPDVTTESSHNVKANSEGNEKPPLCGVLPRRPPVIEGNTGWPNWRILQNIFLLLPYDSGNFQRHFEATSPRVRNENTGRP